MQPTRANLKELLEECGWIESEVDTNTTDEDPDIRHRVSSDFRDEIVQNIDYKREKNHIGGSFANKEFVFMEDYPEYNEWALMQCPSNLSKAGIVIAITFASLLRMIELVTSIDEVFHVHVISEGGSEGLNDNLILYITEHSWTFTESTSIGTVVSYLDAR